MPAHLVENYPVPTDLHRVTHTAAFLARSQVVRSRPLGAPMVAQTAPTSRRQRHAVRRTFIGLSPPLRTAPPCLRWPPHASAHTLDLRSES